MITNWFLAFFLWVSVTIFGKWRLWVHVLSGAVHKITSNECTQTHPLLLIKGVSPLKSCIPYWPNQKVTPWAWNSIMCTMYSAHNQFCTPGRISNVFRHCSQLSELFPSQADYALLYREMCKWPREASLATIFDQRKCIQNQASFISLTNILLWKYINATIWRD